MNKVLFLSSYVPRITGGGTSTRSALLLNLLAQRYKVMLLALSDDKDGTNDVPGSLAYNIRTVKLGWVGEPPFTTRVRRVFGRTPYQVQAFCPPAMRIAIADEINRFEPQVMHIDLLRMAWAASLVYDRCACVLDISCIEHQGFLDQRQTSSLSLRHHILAWWEYLRLKNYEIGACRRADWIVTNTEEDAHTIASLANHTRVTSLPYPLDTEYFYALTNPNTTTLIFAGSMFYRPNVDGALWFAEKILPLIAAKVPEVRWLVVGHRPSPEVKELGERSHITVTGSVPDVRLYFARSSVCVIPIRLKVGGGIRIKLLEAMAMGMPVVTTSIGCIGVPLIPDEHALVCDRPESFAEAVVLLLKSIERRRQIGEAAARFVRRQYNPERSGALLEEVYKRAIANRSLGYSRLA